MLKENFIKHRGIIASTTAFMLFFLGYLFLNSAVQSTAVNAVNYSAYLNQLSLNSAQLSGSTSLTTSTLESSLGVLKTGGEVSLKDGALLQLEPLSKLLNEDVAVLAEIKSNLDTGNLNAVELALAELAQKTDAVVERKIRLVDTLQVIVGIFALLLYIMITFLLIKRLAQTEDVEVKSKQEAEGILNTVSEGLFLLGRDHEIGIEQSASLKEIFKQERDLEGNFFDFISQYITQGDLQVAKDYLDLLFGDRVKEKLVASLNPLNKVEINIVRRDGSFENRYLDFHFKRVVEDGELKHILGSVTDITKQVLLEKELEEAKEEQETQMDLLKSILHIDNNQLKAFFRTAEEVLNHINSTLEENKRLGQHEIQAMLKDIAEDVHRIKGDSAALGLHQFEFSSHEFEDEIKTVISNPKITGKELLPLTINLRSMFKDLDNMKTLVDKFSSSFAAMSTAPAPSTPAASETTPNDATDSGGELDTAIHNVDETSAVSTSNDSPVVSKLNTIIETVSTRNNKPVQLSTSGFDSVAVPDDIEEKLASVAIQLARNAVVHGGETEEDRLAKGKPGNLELRVNLSKTQRGYELVVRDDGKGIDEQAILQRAVELGLATQEELEAASFASCLKYLFHSGFSNETEAGLDAGRGVGLPLVRKILKESKGKISVTSKKEAYSQFHLVFPASITEFEQNNSQHASNERVSV